MQDNSYLDVLTPKQVEAVDMLAYADLHTIAAKLNLTPEILMEWEQEPAFVRALKEREDYLTDNLRREIIFEANRLYGLYCGLQEHMTLNQRVDFLAAVSKAVFTSVKVPGKDEVRDALLDLRMESGLADTDLAAVLTEPELGICTALDERGE